MAHREATSADKPSFKEEVGACVCSFGQWRRRNSELEHRNSSLNLARNPDLTRTSSKKRSSTRGCHEVGVRSQDSQGPRCLREPTRVPSDPKKQAKLRPWPSSANLSMYVPPGLVGSLEIDFDVNPGRPRTPIRLAPGTARPRHSTRRFIPAPLHSHAGDCLPVHLLRRRSTTTSPWEAERPTRSNAGPRIEETKSARRRAWQRGSRIAALVHRALLLLAVLELAAAVATPQNLTRSEPEANNRIHNRILVQLCGGQEPLRGGSQSKPLQEGY